jgi:hypothetical protein
MKASRKIKRQQTPHLPTDKFIVKALESLNILLLDMGAYTWKFRVKRT